MTIKQFIKEIKFNDLQPMQDGVGHYANVGFEFSNTVFPEDNDLIKSNMEVIQNIPKYSTLAIAGVVTKAVQLMPENQVYLNIGYLFGYSLFAGMVGNNNKTCIGVDNFSDSVDCSSDFHKYWKKMMVHNQKSKFYEMDYKEYLNNIHKEQIGVYYYDAIHTREDQYNALVMAEKFLVSGSIVIIDDINIEPMKTSTERFIKEREDLYETLFIAETFGNGHPTWWNGIYVFRKKV